MAKIDRITKVDIVLNTAGLSEMGFDTILIADAHAATVERVITITDPDDLLDYGFPVDGNAYQNALAAFSQTPRPTQMKVGKLSPDNVGIMTKSTAVDTGAKYSITIEGKVNGEIVSEVAEYTAIAADTTTIVMQALADALEAFTTFTVTVLPPGPGILTIDSVTGADTSDAWAVRLSEDTLKISGLGMPTDITPELDAIYSVDADWYGLVGIDFENLIEDVAAWAQAHEVIMGIRGYDPAILSPSDDTDIFSRLKAANYSRVFGFYVASPDMLAKALPQTGIMAKKFAAPPGSETWANATLTGIESTPLNEGQAQAVFDKNGNTFEPFRNLALTQNGRMFNGEWIDIIRFVDWLKERIRVLCTSALVDTRVPYTDPGILKIGAALEQALVEGVRSGGIAPDELDENDQVVPSYVISLPRSASIPPNTKASRKLSNVTFRARLAGAIHTVEIEGTVHY